MNVAQLLILQIIAHLLSDFTFQSEKQAEEKDKKGFASKSLKWHILITFLCSWLFSLQWLFVFASTIIALIHWLLDGYKNKISKYGFIGKYTFFIDQWVHLCLIVVVALIYTRFFDIQTIFPIVLNTKYLAIAAAYLFCAKPSNIFVYELFLVTDIKTIRSNSTSENNPNSGRLIGVFERWLVLTFILTNQFEAIGFLVTAKSILRFKDTDILKTEYVLIGTMLSFGIALALGLAIQRIPEYLF